MSSASRKLEFEIRSKNYFVVKLCFYYTNLAGQIQGQNLTGAVATNQKRITLSVESCISIESNITDKIAR